MTHGGTNCPQSNKRSLSTNRSKKAATLVAARQGASTAVGAAGATSRLGPRDMRKRLTMSVTFTGGPCCHFLIEVRGRRMLFEGHEYLYEVMRRISAAQGF
jgi:hypothetical protein